MRTPLEKVLERVEGVQEQRNGFWALCPAHDDHNPSLHIQTGEDGRALLVCRAGCRQATVMAALEQRGLKPSDLFADERGGAVVPLNSRSKGSRRPRKSLGQLVKSYTVKDASGREIAVHERWEGEAGKSFLWKHPNGKYSRNGDIKPETLPLHGAELVAGWPEGCEIALVEGETPAEALRAAGVRALGTVTGAKSIPNRDILEIFRGHPVTLWADGDPAGHEHMQRVGSSLDGIATEVRWYEWQDPPENVKGPDAADHPAVKGGEPEMVEELTRELWGAPLWTRPPSREDAAWAMCEMLARKTNITAEFAKALKRMGVAGESRLLRLLYLVLSSRRLDKPVSVAVKGPSSGGKSHAVEKVLEAFPDSAYYELTAMSEKALIYLDEDMRHRFLVVFEASGMAGDMQTYLMRTLLSENRIRYQTAESTSQGVKPRLLELEGPTGLIVTTTQTRMHPENETRLLSLTVTDTREQTKDIFRAMAEEDREPVDLEPWRQLQVWLEDQARIASIPYARALADLVPPVAVRLRRDFGAVLQLVRAHAVLHQASRAKDNKGRVVATLEDYAVVRELIADLVAEGVDATVSPIVRETVRAVERLTEDAEHVGLKPLANELKLDKASASRRVKTARDAGYLINLEETKGKPAKLAIGDPLPADLVILPEPETLRAEWDRCTVATVQGGRGEGEKNDAESVAGAECNGAQHRNGQGPRQGKNGTFSPSSGESDSQKTPTNGHIEEEQGRGSFESATPQHSAHEAEEEPEASATQRSAQRSDGLCKHGQLVGAECIDCDLDGLFAEPADPSSGDSWERF